MYNKQFSGKKFQRNNSEESTSIGPNPHPDWEKNKLFFGRCMSQVIWTFPDQAFSSHAGVSNPVRYSIHGDKGRIVFDDSENYKAMNMLHCVFFNYPSVPWEILKSKGWSDTNVAKNWEIILDDWERKTSVISFHQTSRKSAKFYGFNEELCAILNRLGSLGYISHKSNPSQKKEEYSEWSGEKWFNSLGA